MTGSVPLAVAAADADARRQLPTPSTASSRPI
jgi:hypothetical protein